jgi:hypothetical protein
VPVTTNNFCGHQGAGSRRGQPRHSAKGIPRVPYAERANPPAQKSRTVGGKTWSQVQPRGIAYWERYNEYMQQEPVHERDRMMTAMLAPLGLEKGKPFAPADREKKLLADGALIGELMSMNISYALKITLCCK